MTKNIKKELALANYCVDGDSIDFSEACVELLSDGGVALYNCWQDYGQSFDLGFLSIAHKALKPLEVTVDKIRLIMNDTAFSLDGDISVEIRGQVFLGNAMKDACEKLIKAMKKEDGSYMTYDEMVAAKKDLRYVGNFTPSLFCRQKVT